MSRLVFGEADPRDYMEPICECGHVRSEHYNADGGEPAGARSDGVADDGIACWAEWVGDRAGCDCAQWRQRP